MANVDLYQTEHLINPEKIKKLQNTFSLEEWSKKYNIDISQYNNKQKEKLTKHLKKNPFFYMKWVDLNLENLSEKTSETISNKTWFSKETIAKQKEEFNEFLNAKEDFIKKIVWPEKLSLTSIEKKANKAKKEATKKVEQKVKEVKEDAKKKIAEVSWWDKITKIFDKIIEWLSKSFDTLWKKFLAATGFWSVLSYFWLSDDKEDDKPEKNTVENEENMSTEKIQKQLEKEGKVDTVPKDENGKKIDTNSEKNKNNLTYVASLKTMLSLSWINIDNSKTQNPILKNISNNTYKDITSLSDTEKNKFLDGWWTKDTFNKIIEQLKSDKFQKIANYTFKWKFLENIIKKDWVINPKILKKIDWWEEWPEKRLNKILEWSKESEKNPKWWKNKLTMWEISLFYGLSFWLLTIPIWKWLNELKTSIWWLFFDDTKDLNETKNTLISEKIIKNFTKNWLTNFWWNDFIKNDKNTKKEISKNLNKNEKEQLEKLINFKNYVLVDYLKQTKPILTEGEKELFKNKITYWHIIAIYSIMWWNKNISKQNVLNRFSLNYINSKILWPIEWATYLWKIAYNVLFENNIDLFTKEEKEVLKIYRDKFLQIAIWYNIIQIWQKLNFISSATHTDLNKLGIWLWVWWLGFKFIWTKLTKKWAKIALESWKTWLKTVWKWAKWLWWLWILSWIALWGYSFYNEQYWKFDWLKKDLENAWDNTEKILKILEEYKNAISEPKTIDWKTFQIIKYKNDTPLVIMDKKIYTFDIVDAPILEKLKNTDFSNKEWFKLASKAILRNILDIFPDSKETTINWQRIDRTDINIEWNQISFWKEWNQKKYTINELLNWISNKKIQIDKSMIKEFENFIEKDIPYLSWKDIYYYRLKNLDNQKFIALVEIWDLNKKPEN